MKKFLLTLVLFLFASNVKAASLCSYAEQVEINEKAGNVDTSYDVVEEVIKESPQANTYDYYINVSILNVTDDFRVVVKNNINDMVYNFNYEDAKNGIITLKWRELQKVTNFTIELYTTDKTSCPDELHKTIYMSTPRQNRLSLYDPCIENSDFSLCQKYVFFDEVSREDFMNQFEQYKQEKQKKEEEKKEQEKNEKQFKYIPYIIGGAVGLAGITLLTIKVVKIIKKRRDIKARGV